MTVYKTREKELGVYFYEKVEVISAGKEVVVGTSFYLFSVKRSGAC